MKLSDEILAILKPDDVPLVDTILTLLLKICGGETAALGFSVDIVGSTYVITVAYSNKSINFNALSLVKDVKPHAMNIEIGMSLNPFVLDKSSKQDYCILVDVMLDSLSVTYQKQPISSPANKKRKIDEK